MDIQESRCGKRRRLADNSSVATFTPDPQTHYTHKSSSFQTNATISTPSAQTTLPTAVFSAQSPEELVYTVLTNPKPLYSKQEVLSVMDRLLKMIQPSFSEPCSYIS